MAAHLIETLPKRRGPQQKGGSEHEELKLTPLFTQAIGSHSPTFTMVEFVPLTKQPGGRVKSFKLGTEGQESSEFSNVRKQMNIRLIYWVEAETSQISSIQIVGNQRASKLG